MIVYLFLNSNDFISFYLLNNLDDFIIICIRWLLGVCIFGNEYRIN